MLIVRGIGLVCAGEIVCVVGVNGIGVGRVFVVGGHLLGCHKGNEMWCRLFVW